VLDHILAKYKESAEETLRLVKGTSFYYSYYYMETILPRKSFPWGFPTHLSSPNIADKAALLTFPNRSRFCAGEDSG
jgi:hypothetical protein